MATANLTQPPAPLDALLPCSVAQGHLFAVADALWEVLSQLPPQADERANQRLGRALSLADLASKLAEQLGDQLESVEIALRATQPGH